MSWKKCSKYILKVNTNYRQHDSNFVEKYVHLHRKRYRTVHTETERYRETEIERQVSLGNKIMYNFIFFMLSYIFKKFLDFLTNLFFEQF